MRDLPIVHSIRSRAWSRIKLGHADVRGKIQLTIALTLMFLGGFWVTVNPIAGLFIVGLGCYGAIVIFQRALDEARSKLLETRQELRDANTTLEKILAKQNSNVQLLVKLQEIGGLIGWWYDSETREVQYAESRNFSMASFHIDDPKADEPWQNKLRKLVKHVMVTGEDWDNEVESENRNGKPVWLRSMGEAQKIDGKVVRIIGLVQDLTDKITLTNKLTSQASTDELTGLLNRRYFNTALGELHSEMRKLTNPTYLFFLDLDQFKIVNDTSGHNAGDQLLRIVGNILTKNVRNDDIVARLGGDEFAIILKDCPRRVAVSKAEAIRAEIESLRFSWQDNVYSIGVSIGIVDASKSEGDPAELLQLADAACYEAKASGRNRVHLVDQAEGSIQKHRGDMRWVQRLNEAMDNGRFAIYGQQIVPTSGQDEGYERLEVLLRLRDPISRKLIPPGAFLPAAERYGLSIKLDRWVLRHLLTMLYVHNEVGANQQRYWINLSGCSVGDDQFVDFLIDAIRDIDLPPGMVNFEITETAVIRKLNEADRLIRQLHDLGCEFALDDFGSGVSSIEYLKKLPVDYIKIDGRFVKNVLHDDVDRIFVKSIVDVAHSMEIKAIAEFVESPDILNAVKKMGVDYVQGFSVHRPVLLAPEFPSMTQPAAPARKAATS